jgi:osmoprotectant transport system ATP-binding protein
VIAFENVTVAFESTPALTDITFTVEPGALCVLVGPSGSGKSTLLRLVNRLVDPTQGRVLVRGADVASVDPAPLRRSIG